ncbi:MAG: hypothetical protein WCR27_01650 [Eubacteriales bacterium]
MVKAIKATFRETRQNISTNEIEHAYIATTCTGDQHWVKRISTKKDNALKGVMKAHLEERSKQAIQ